MHSIYFVLLPKNDADNNKSARTQAINLLEQENFFGSNGYWGGGKGDWGVVGGRWTGILSGTEVEINDEKAKNYRSTYLREGYEDDAMILTDEILIRLTNKENDYSNTEVFISNEYSEASLTDIIKTKKDYVGKYWIVVIDYHY